MDIPKEVIVTKAKESSSSSMAAAALHIDVPIGVQVVTDIGDIGFMLTDSSDSDIGTVVFCSPNEPSKESKKTFDRFLKANDNGNDTDLQTEAESEAKAEAELNMFNGFEDIDDGEKGLATFRKSPSIQGHYSSSEASCTNFQELEGSELFEDGDIVLGPNIDRVISKHYTPSLNRISDDLDILQQLPINENPWDFFQNNAATSPTMPRDVTPAAPKSTNSVGIQVNNPEVVNFLMRDTHCDWIRCMMCAVIVSCIISGLCAATVMILNTFFQYWLLP